jgi:hypothetical protein
MIPDVRPAPNVHAVAQAALPDELFLEAYDLLLERFYNRALYEFARPPSCIAAQDS